MLLIFADDLTGALDAAAPFAGRGLVTEIAMDLDGVQAALAEAPDVLSVNLGCRDGTAEEAQRRTKTLLASLPDDVVLFKKIDSRLKGHIAAELDAISFGRALVVPAIPDFGRVVANGALQGFGVDEPISISATLGRHAGRSTVPDVASQEDLRVALLKAQEDGVDLLIGARGLAEALAQQMTGRTATQPAKVPEGKGLFVIGSRDPITLSQIDHLVAKALVRTLAAPNGVVPQDEADISGPVLVQATQGSQSCSQQDVSDHLAAGVVPILTASARTLLLSGGATAEAVLRAMGISRLRLAGECLPGLGVGVSGDHCIIAKSGGFGQAGTLTQIAKMMLGRHDAGES